MSSDLALGRYVRGTHPNGQFPIKIFLYQALCPRIYVPKIKNLALSVNKILS